MIASCYTSIGSFHVLAPVVSDKWLSVKCIACLPRFVPFMLCLPFQLMINKVFMRILFSEVFYGTQYHPTVVRWYYQFFQFCIMGKMVICSMYIIWKIFPRCQGYIKRLDFIYYINIILYISDNTHKLLIPPIPH
jgi:hypothetical protein